VAPLFVSLSPRRFVSYGEHKGFLYPDFLHGFSPVYGSLPSGLTPSNLVFFLFFTQKIARRVHCPSPLPTGSAGLDRSLCFLEPFSCEISYLNSVFAPFSVSQILPPRQDRFHPFSPPSFAAFLSANESRSASSSRTTNIIFPYSPHFFFPLFPPRR